MQKINLQIIFLGIGFLFLWVNWHVDVKALWYLGCVCIIISPFLSGRFSNAHQKETAKKRKDPFSDSNQTDPANSSTQDDSQ